jgi:rubrerythrin
MAAGTVKGLTRKSRPSTVDADSKRRLIRTVLRPRQHLAASRRPRYRCAGCGYGIVADGVLPRCPMCRANDWLPSTGK